MQLNAKDFKTSDNKARHHINEAACLLHMIMKLGFPYESMSEYKIQADKTSTTKAYTPKGQNQVKARPWGTCDQPL